MVPHDPVATGHSTAPSFEAVLPVTVNVTALRTYALPDTSVPPPASPGGAVNRPIYHAVGRVALEAVNSHVSVVVSNVFVSDI
jgi:hypothetical protein